MADTTYPGFMVRGGSQLGDIPTGQPISFMGGFSPVPTSAPGSQIDATSAGNIARGVSTYGLQVGQGLYDAQQVAYRNGMYGYPGFTASQQQAPSQAAMYDYTPTAPIQQIQAPNYQYTAGNAPQYNTPGVGNNPFISQYMQNGGIQSPSVGQYQGLMGGDYEALQQALQTPGQLEAQRAYELGQKQLEAKMGAQGLYGSTMMGTGMTDLNRGYQETLAKNAAAAAQQRYGMQAQDLQAMNQYNLGAGQLGANIYGQNLQTGLGLSQQNLTNAQQQAQLGLGVYNTQIGQQQAQNAFNMSAADMQRNQAYDTWKTQATETANQQTYNQQQMAQQQAYLDSVRNWQNQGNYEQYQYQLAAQQYQQQLEEQMLNRAMALAGQGAPLSQAGTNYQQAMNQLGSTVANQQAQASQANLSGWLGALGTGAGLMTANQNAGWNALGGAASQGYNYLSGLMGNNGMTGYETANPLGIA